MLRKVVDPNVAPAQTVADRYGFAEVCGDADQLADPDIDIIADRCRVLLPAAGRFGRKGIG